ncbi:MAG: ParA family protein [Aliarcobacter sp.]|nr:ParA family protein [Aliarcobacter sp.]
MFFVNSIAAKRNQETIEVLQPKTGSELLDIINNYDGHIVIDAGGFDNDINRIALSNADKILVPISPSAVEVIGFMTFETILNDVNATAVNLVLNNIHPLQRDFTDIQNAVSHNGIKLLNTIVRSRKTYKDVMGLGKSVFEHTDLRATAEIEELKNELF